jgi:2-dehydropantoate 2-reductase
LQNGIDGGETLAREYGERRVWAGPAYVSAHILEPGIIRYFAGRSYRRFGTWDRRPDALAAAFVDICNAAGFRAELVEDVRELLWTKFILLATNGVLSAASRLPVFDIYRDPDLRAVAVAAMREVEAVARAVGAPVASDVVETCIEFAETIPAGSRASICNDLLRGARIEIEGLSGAVVRLAGQHGVATPIQRTLYAVLKPYRDGPIEI